MAFRKRGGKKQNSHVSDETTLSETDGPFKSSRGTTTTTRKQLNNDHFLEMRPDKELEERVLCDCSEFLTSNLPADDVAPVMMTRNLLTTKEHEEYKAMKRSGRSTMTCMSEYLVECLRKRKAGFLKRFCEILWEIEPAHYLGDHIKNAYKEVQIHGGFNTHSRDRLSKISISDPDLRPKTPQGNVAVSCTFCKSVKKRNRQLEKFNSELKEQLIEIDRNYSRLQEAKLKVEGQLEILQDQLTQEKQNLEKVIPHLQQAIGLMESSCRVTSASGSSGAQQTLNRITDLIKEQSKHEKLPTVLKRRHIRVHPPDSSKRDSILSIFSDTSSVTESSLADEDMIRSHSGDIPATPERNRLSADLSKPVVSDLHRSLVHSPTTSKSQLLQQHQFGNKDEEASLPVKVTERIQESKLDIEVPVQQKHSIKEKHHSQPHARSESFPDFVSTTKESKSQANASSRTTRLYSAPDESTRPVRRQSLKRESKVKPYSQKRVAMIHPPIQSDDSELSQILNKRREKLDSESEISKQCTSASTQ